MDNSTLKLSSYEATARTTVIALQGHNLESIKHVGLSSAWRVRASFSPHPFNSRFQVSTFLLFLSDFLQNLVGTKEGFHYNTHRGNT